MSRGRPERAARQRNRLERRQHHRAGLAAGTRGPLVGADAQAGVAGHPRAAGTVNGGDLTIEGAVPVRAGTVAPRPLNVEVRGLSLRVPRACAVSSTRTSLGEAAASGPRCPSQITIASDTIGNLSLRLRPRSRRRARAVRDRCRWRPGCGDSPRHPPQLSRSDRRHQTSECQLAPDMRVTGTVGRPALDGR